MIIDCTVISDLHGFLPSDLPGGDLLIICGDLTARDTGKEYENFNTWLLCQEYKKKIVIAGNHDNFLIQKHVAKLVCMGGEYLCDSGTEFEGLKIWGSPWTQKFKGQNPKAMAFTLDTEEELAEKWDLIPDDTDILITHGPPFGVLDKTVDDRYVGDESLGMRISELDQLKIHCFGHLHESYGSRRAGYIYKIGCEDEKTPIGHLSINCSHVNENYEPVNKPVRIII